MKALDGVDDLVVEALRALPPGNQDASAQLLDARGDLAALRRARTARASGVATIAARAGGRLLHAALLARPGAAAERLLQACSLLLEVEAVCRDPGPPPRGSSVLRTPEAVRGHLETHGSLRAVRVEGVKAALSLAGVDLSASVWIAVDLSGSDLRGANLSEARFDEARLVDADLTGADLTGADLTGVDLTTTKIRGAVLVRCLLVEVNAEGLDLAGCDLTDATWKRAKLRGARGDGLAAHRVSFVEADLRAARLPKLDAPHADLTGAALEGAELTGACLRDASLERAVLQRVIARDVDFDRARLVGADIRGSSLAGATLRYADLSHAMLDRSTLVGAVLSHANLHRTSREGADFTDADLRGTRATDPDRARAEDFRRSP
jgi:uncharacterized protein YjbI with pentapeptide repeats